MHTMRLATPPSSPGPSDGCCVPLMNCVNRTRVVITDKSSGRACLPTQPNPARPAATPYTWTKVGSPCSDQWSSNTMLMLHKHGQPVVTSSRVSECVESRRRLARLCSSHGWVFATTVSVSQSSILGSAAHSCLTMWLLGRERNKGHRRKKNEMKGPWRAIRR